MQFSLERAAAAEVTVKYTSTGGRTAGLFNQHIAHEHAFMLAVALKVRMGNAASPRLRGLLLPFTAFSFTRKGGGWQLGISLGVG